MDELLLIWDQGGERPYEVLQELNRYDEFLKYLFVFCETNQVILSRNR